MSTSRDHLARLLLIQSESPSRLEDDLLRFDVVARRIPQTVSANAVYQCGLRDGREAFHKPHEGMHPHPRLGFPVWQLYGHPSASATGINECAAWRLARAMGSPWDTLVATSVMRWLPSGPGLIGGWGPLTRKGNGPSGQNIPFALPELCSPAALFDALIGQQDRHTGNQRYESTTGRLTLIDHGFSFPAGRWHFNQSEFVHCRHESGETQLTPAELALLDALPKSTVWRELELILAPEQMAALEWRRARMHDKQLLLPATPEGLGPS